jgi:hypothetical protein
MNKSNPHRTSIKPVRSKKMDFNKLWKRLRTVYETAGKVRNVAVLDNFQHDKESICRRLNVVCDADVNRIADELKSD